MRTFRIEKTPPPNPPLGLFKFDQVQQLDLEIGAGQGLHAISYCKENPNRTLLAVEQTHARFGKLFRRHQNHKYLDNLRPIHADAVAFVYHLLKNESLDRIFILYPNPYPKSKQSNLRWHNRPFMKILIEKLRIGGTLTLATNLQWYALEARDKFDILWNLKNIEFRILNQSSQPRTHFERKYLERGETCWHLKFEKRDNEASQYSNVEVE